MVALAAAMMLADRTSVKAWSAALAPAWAILALGPLNDTSTMLSP